MILINLLPHREAARKRRRELFFVSLGLAALIGGAIAGAVFLWYQAKINVQESRNQFLTVEIKKLDEQIKEIATLQSEISALKARQQAVEDLQADRNLPVQLMNELVAQLPDGVFINRLSQRSATSIEFGGSAQSDERVNELLRNLSYASEWIGAPELIEIVGAQYTMPGSRDAGTRRIANFSMRAQLKRPSAQAPAALAAASRPTPAASKAAGSVSAPASAPASNPATAPAASAAEAKK